MYKESIKCKTKLVIELFRFVLVFQGKPVVHTAIVVQCESKKSPCGFLTFFFSNGWEFIINFYTPIIRSFLQQTTNFYSITSNFDEVMPY